MQKDFYRRGQGILEYSMVVICIVAGLLAMQYYIKRAIQGRVRQSADTIGEQYAPGHMDSQITITQKGTTTVKAEAIQGDDDDKFGMEIITNTDETQTRTG